MNPISSEELRGSWAPIILPYDDSGNIDFARLSDQIDVLIASEPNGIYSNGTTGEFFAQSADEFIQISILLSEKCEAAEIPYQIGVSHTSPQISWQRLEQIQDLRPSAVQLILPDWCPPTLQECETFLSKMATSTDGIGLVLYNPPGAKKVLTAEEWAILKADVPQLIGLKVYDHDGDPAWYRSMRKNVDGISVFIPGHNLATGITMGAHGAYSNMACLNPFAAQAWYRLMLIDMPAALAQETRILRFMKDHIIPLITKESYTGFACDRLLALIGGWADVGASVRWPYRSPPIERVQHLRRMALQIIPEFFP